MGGGRSKRRCCAAGNQKVNALLPDAEAWDFARYQRTSSRGVELQSGNNWFLPRVHDDRRALASAVLTIHAFPCVLLVLLMLNFTPTDHLRRITMPRICSGAA